MASERFQYLLPGWGRRGELRLPGQAVCVLDVSWDQKTRSRWGWPAAAFTERYAESSESLAAIPVQHEDLGATHTTGTRTPNLFSFPDHSSSGLL